MQVHETGQGDQAVRVDGGGTGRVETGPDRGDEPALQSDVGTRAVDQLRAADQVSGHATDSFASVPVSFASFPVSAR